LYLPAVAALRKNASLPDLDQQPAIRGERELVRMLHAQTGRLGRSPSVDLIGHRVSQVRRSLVTSIPGATARDFVIDQEEGFHHGKLAT
jgi:hypothetical protein